MPAKEINPPDAKAAKLLHDAGLTLAGRNHAFNALCYRGGIEPGGVLYAPSRPLPWGVYWWSSRRQWEFIWTLFPETALIVWREGPKRHLITFADIKPTSKQATGNPPAKASRKKTARR